MAVRLVMRRRAVVGPFLLFYRCYLVAVVASSFVVPEENRNSWIGVPSLVLLIAGGVAAWRTSRVELVARRGELLVRNRLRRHRFSPNAIEGFRPCRGGRGHLFTKTVCVVLAGEQSVPIAALRQPVIGARRREQAGETLGHLDRWLSSERKYTASSPEPEPDSP